MKVVQGIHVRTHPGSPLPQKAAIHEALLNRLPPQTATPALPKAPSLIRITLQLFTKKHAKCRLMGPISREMASVGLRCRPGTYILTPLPTMPVMPMAGGHTRSPSVWLLSVADAPLGFPWDSHHRLWSPSLPQVPPQTPEFMNRKVGGGCLFIP